MSMSTTAKVIESAYLISGGQLALLEYKKGIIEVGSVLVSNDNKWRVIKSNLPFGKNNPEFQKTMKDNQWRLYQIESLTNGGLPQVKSEITIIPQ